MGVLSLWDDADDHMKWLDSTEPVGSTNPGAARGPCSPSSGSPSEVRSKHADAWVEYSNFKYGEIGSTTSQTAPAAAAAAAARQPRPSPKLAPPSSSTGSCCWNGCGSDS